MNEPTRAAAAAAALSLALKTPVLRVFSLDQLVYVSLELRPANLAPCARMLTPGRPSGWFEGPDVLIEIQVAGRGEFVGFDHLTGQRFEVAVGGGSAEVYDGASGLSYAFTR
ncbi:hypothetical protein SLNSH_13915 [Alsobacter soli]|uniref:Uncharacterized protein n=1 Tax=Alsobacter soli TaxID=2109933 RepID=A0A2T1HRP8_9HYPH|nr:hypothetical protein [Alsobacter soli]PSC04323.1 hypothetical protein SLNSH_13915 [Alsobacter soli]